MSYLRHIIPNKIGWIVLPLAGYFAGRYLDLLETERLTLFRDKSALYGRLKKEGEAPSWP